MECTGNPKFKWVPLMLHFGLAVMLAWITQQNMQLFEPINSISVQVASWIPSIEGYAAMSIDAGFTRTFLVVTWAGAPYHVIQWTKIMRPVLRTWVQQLSTFRFWITIVTWTVLALSALILPSMPYQPTDATEGIRATAQLVSLMKENSPVLLLVSFTMVYIFSFLIAAELVVGYLRLFAVDVSVRNKH